MRIDNTIQQSYARLSSGYRINSAADDAAGLAISQQLSAQVNGYDQGTQNAQSSQNLANTAEGSLSGIQDSLQRIRELAVQASNGLYTADDRKMIQSEINQLKNGIQESAKNTEFNTIKLLDGSYSDANIAAGTSGTGKTMSIQNSSLDALGIANFDVTQNFDISTIDHALAQVSDSRANLGSVSNSLDYMMNANNTASQNLASSESQISGADMAKTISDLKNNQLLQKIQMYALQSKMSQSSSVLNLFG